MRDFFTVLALSLHAVFEGLAVGLEDEAKDVWMLFAGRKYHKSSIRSRLCIISNPNVLRLVLEVFQKVSILQQKFF